MKDAQSASEKGLLTGQDGQSKAQRGMCPIAVACDGSYAMQLATLLVSAVDANRSGQPLDIYVLCERFPVRLRHRVIDPLPEESVSIHWTPVDLSSFAGIPTTPHISSRMQYARFMIPRVFSTDVRRVLYLDADTLVLDDLVPLGNVDLRGGVIGAVLDRGRDPILKARVPGLDRELDRYPHVRDYFNNGVFLIDLDAWRKERVSERAVDYLMRHPDSPFMDQDAMNVVCDGGWTQLDIRWNFYDHFNTAILEMPLDERPGIVHFAGCQKPWDAAALSVNADLYEMFRNRTRFARNPADKALDLVRRSWSRAKVAMKRTPVGKALRHPRRGPTV
jgi:lipopolysaccharide biosynthesis glycosyltransferase